MSIEVICPYCQKKAKLVDSEEIYGIGYNQKMWVCWPCQAWVGTHRNSRQHKPLGRLADAKLRKWKMAAHSAFDPLWKAKMEKENCSLFEARKAGYQWLADHLGIEVKNCHIGMFDCDTCMRVVALCEPYLKKK